MRDSKGRFIKGNKHSKEIELKRIQSIKESYKYRGGWNKGLTKETDERIRKISENNLGKTKGIKFSEERKNNISKSLKGKPKSEEHIKNVSERLRKINHHPPKEFYFKKDRISWNKGKKMPEIEGNNNPSKRLEVREKIRKAKLNQYQNKEYKEKFLNSVKNEKTKEKCRKSRIKYIEQTILNGNPLYPTVGKYEKQILNNLEESFNYPILRQHRMAGYFLDGFCPALNLAIEIDEKYHLNTKQRQSDIDRDNYLKTKFDCQILRINVNRR